MCSFLVTTLAIVNLAYCNYYQTFRGPDKTNHVVHNGVSFVHNLLHLTGVATIQPFISKSDSSDIVALFNGEIYNYESIASELGLTLHTDGEALIPAYKQYGLNFTQHFDGEFAVVLWDFQKKLVIVSTDTFGVKPLWYAKSSGHIAFASYESAIVRLGFGTDQTEEMDPNTILVFSTTDFSIISRSQVHTFDLRQYKQSLTDWTFAFENSIRKRTHKLQYDVFIGLSSGYDSGAISCALNKLKIPHKSFTIVGSEESSIIRARLEATALTNEPTVIQLSAEDYQVEYQILKETCEPYFYLQEDGSRNRSQHQMLAFDPAATGLGYICKLAKSRKMRIYLSGSGADEIMSDYGFQGEKFYPHSSFGGLFPNDLESIFPWPSFYFSTQRNYLRKEEYIAGAHSMEGRYPFLDLDVVQEYLWLTADMKNQVYKHPVYRYLQDNNYPVSKNTKIGFNVLPAQHIVSQATTIIIMATILIGLSVTVCRRHRRHWRL